MEELKNMLNSKIDCLREKVSKLRHQEQVCGQLLFNHQSRVIGEKIEMVLDQMLYLRDTLRYIEDNIIETDDKKDDH